MEAKLKSIFREPRSALALKSAVFGGFLLLLKLGDFRLLPILFFLWAAFLLSSWNYQPSFLFFLGIAMATAKLLESGLFLFLAAVIFSALFYLSVGIKELLIVHRQEWGFIKNLILFYALFLLFFISDKSGWFLAKYLGIFLAAFFILKDWFLASESSFLKRAGVAAGVLALLDLQLLWIVGLLPLGPVNAANLMVLITYILFNFTIHHFQGQIDRRFVFRKIAIFVLLLIFIFATSRWWIG